MARSRSGHVWRWSDEDPEAIVPLVILIFLIIAVPWGSCGPDASHGAPHPVTSYALAGVDEELLNPPAPPPAQEVVEPVELEPSKAAEVE